MSLRQSVRFAWVALALDEAGFLAFATDHRGHGRTGQDGPTRSVTSETLVSGGLVADVA
ncbi:hypothetical protein YM304_04380 [Ilumatobacter coccineus YM16-304]|uniref:Uncharacterized protein n=1 Tax=Ilumatobacter coccineus (strain NBRC 103263 / KCTC 29153 / YM16-304) TaxID=1313172 RepID=A0A6C7E2Y5_ILUCY|nr:hypothetical protein YM304_04380 [Ilumatobacter coccineus YM16-304]